MKATKLNNILKQRYDLDLLIEPVDYEHLQFVYEHYYDQRSILRSSPLMESTDQYTKAYLISEAALMILREIAPKRKRKKKKGS